MGATSPDFYNPTGSKHLMRVVHYLNQFFGGVGGEEQAGMPPEVRDGAAGPGLLLETVLPSGSRGVSTIVCGDNYAAEHPEEIQALAVATVKEAEAGLLVAGPCFEAGRYGTAAGGVCAAVQQRLGVTALAAMSPENPGVDLYRRDLYIVDSGPNPAGMRQVLTNVVTLAGKIIANQPIGRPEEEGYIPRGLLRSEFVEQSAAQRLAAMLLAKLKGQPFQSEAPIAKPEPVPAPVPVKDLARAKIALVTDGGLVPKGNPDGIPRAFAQVWGSYSIDGRQGLKGEDYEVSHGGYDISHVQEAPDRLVPVDVLREMERVGIIGQLNNEFYSTTGNANPLENSRRMGREIAQKLKESQVDGVILTST